MTSATILPSIGAPPPEFRRPIVPEKLRPKLVGEGESQPQESGSVRSGSEAPVPSGETSTEGARASQSGGGQSLGAASAVVVQVQESNASPSEDRSGSGPKLPNDLSEEEQAAVRRLQERDREVRNHEKAHASAGGGYAGTPSYEFVRGPDGAQYAVGGHVDIDVAPVAGDPEATIEKMEAVRSAALAPAQPSGQDRAVAAAAEAKLREAQAELNKQKQEEFAGGETGPDSSSGSGAVEAEPVSPTSGNNTFPAGAYATSESAESALAGSATAPISGLNLLV